MANFGSKEHRQGMAGIKRTGSTGRSSAKAARKKKGKAALDKIKRGEREYKRLSALEASGKKLTAAQVKALARHEVSFLRTHGYSGDTDAAVRLQATKDRKKIEAAGKARDRIVSRILGPSGIAQAVKISRADGGSFGLRDVEAFRKAGWEVIAAGTVAGRVGKGGIPGLEFRADDWTFKNPDTLGPTGKARALILAGQVGPELIDELAASGFDVAPAPKKWREGITKNPNPADPKAKKKFVIKFWNSYGDTGSEFIEAISKQKAVEIAKKLSNGDYEFEVEEIKPLVKKKHDPKEIDKWSKFWETPARIKNPTSAANKKVYEAMKAAAKKNQALRVDELAEKTKMPVSSVSSALAELVRLGLAHVAGADLFGSCYFPGVPATGLFANPSAEAKAEKKAADWYQADRLTTKARRIKLPETVEAVEVGEIVAIEYRSNKYDGRSKVWRHEATKPRALHVSTDGKVLVVLPGFKITKRGIEG